MEKNVIKEEIVELLEVIIEQSEVISGYNKQIPQIEIDIILSNIRELYEKYRSLEKLNKNSHNISESEKVEKPKTETIIKPIIKESVISEPETIAPTKNLEEIKQVEEKVAVIEENIETEENPPQKKSKIKKPSVDLFSAHATIADKFKDDKKSLNEKLSSSQTDKSIAAKLQKNPIKDLKTVIGINEKFKFINELFEGNLQKYNDGIAKLNNFSSFEEADKFLLILKEEFSWGDKNEAFYELADLVTRRYL